MSLDIFRKIIYPTLPLNQKKLEKKIGGKWVMITGASHGIGKELAYLLMPVKANLFLIARTEEELQNICADAVKAGCKAEYRAIDLRDRNKLDLLCEEIKTQKQPIDYFFANAGKSIHRSIESALDRLHDYDRTCDLNYRSTVALSLAVLPQMLENGGTVIYTSAVSSLYPAAPGWSAYHASKNASNTWCETADTEFAQKGVRFKIAYLPLVHTQMSDATPVYQKMPAFSAKEAATILARLATSCSITYKPWWARLSAPIAYLLSPIVKFFYRHIL